MRKLAPVVFVLVACGSVPEPETSRADVQRLSPTVNPTQLETAIRGNTDFAFDFYRRIAVQPGNVVYSPHSITSAFAMLWAGARGTTEQALANGLHFPFAQADQHPLLNVLDAELTARNVTVGDADKLTLRVVNDVWAQKGFEILPSYLDTLAQSYGAGVRRLDFARDPEAARNTVNDWVAQKTNDRIQDLLPKGSVDPATRLALTNAVYFKADWKDQFEVSATKSAPFHLAGGTDTNVDFMRRTAPTGFDQTNDYLAVELPYVGDQLALLVLMPNDLARFEALLSGAKLDTITRGLTRQDVDLSLPKLKHEAKYDLQPVLTDMGMGELFVDADLSGIDGERDLFVQAAVHQAFIVIDEEGTEAAAATGITIGVTSVQVVERAIIDRPFLYVLRDTKTNAVLFVGRVSDPR